MSPGNATIDQGVATGTIRNDDIPAEIKPPENVVPEAQTTQQNTELVFSSEHLQDNAISIRSPDATDKEVKVTLSAVNGTLTLSGISGLTFLVGDGESDVEMTFTGTVPSINVALQGMSFFPDVDYVGANAAMTIFTEAQGASGEGGVTSDTDTVQITVLAAAQPKPKPGDLDQDGDVDVDDVNALMKAMNSLSPDPAADLDTNGLVGSADLEKLILEILNTCYGDANLDGVFNSDDVIQVFQAGEYEDSTAGNSSWEEGDWNGDGDFDDADMERASEMKRYEQTSPSLVGANLGVTASVDNRKPLNAQPKRTQPSSIAQQAAPIAPTLDTAAVDHIFEYRDPDARLARDADDAIDQGVAVGDDA